MSVKWCEACEIEAMGDHMLQNHTCEALRPSDEYLAKKAERELKGSEE